MRATAMQARRARTCAMAVLQADVLGEGQKLPWRS